MGGETTQTTTNSPPDWAKGLFAQSATDAQNIYNSGAGGGVYQGQTVADLSPTTTAGITGVANAASNYSNPAYSGLLTNPTSSATNLAGMASGQNLLSNPYFNSALQGQLDKTASQVQSSMSGAGRYGSGADTGALATALGNIRSSALSSQYNQDTANMLTANGQIDSANQNQLGAVNSWNQGNVAANNAAISAGKVLDANEQAKLTAEQAKWTAQDNLPWTRLGLLQSAAAGSAGNYGTNTQVQQQSANPMQIIGGLGSLALKG